MKRKLWILVLALFSFAADSFAQKDTIKVFANNKLIGKKVINEASEPETINIKKSKYTAVKKLTVTISSGRKANDIFKRSLEISANDSMLMEVQELESKHGSYIFNITKLRGALEKNKDVEVYCAENPRNPKMMVRSSRKLLFKMHFE